RHPRSERAGRGNDGHGFPPHREDGLVSAGMRRLPWAILGLTVVLLGATLTLSTLNHALTSDAYFIAIAIVMMLGYVTVGAFVASRLPHNPLGWLLMTTGFSFLLAAGAEEYATYALYTSPGALPFGQIAVWLNNWIFLVAVAPVPLFLALFPTGNVPSPRWRWLPRTLVALFAVGIVGTMLRAGTVDITEGVDPTNPTGIEAITPILEPLLFIVGLISIAVSALAVVSLVLRYRAAHGEERQQIRWIAFVGLAALLLFLGTIATSIGLEQGESTTLNDALFFAFFIMFGIGIPVAAGLAIMRYRLWELDVILKKTIVATVLVVLLTIVSLLVLIAVGGIVVGPLSESPGVALLAGIGVGALTWPLLRLSRRIADRLVYGRRATPYEVLTEFSDRMAESYATDDVLPRMASILGAGTGAKSVTIWLLVGNQLRPATTWIESGRRGSHLLPAEPAPSAELAELTGDVFVVRHQGEQLGAITATMHPNDPMDPTKEKLIRELAGQAGLVLRNVRLIEELRASRRRLVAAQDAERRRLERNIHDGAQQQLVALQVKQRLVQGMIDRDPAKALELMTQLQVDTTEALDDLRDLARGIYPPLLADQGLGAALESQARKSPVPISVETDGVERYPQDVEAAVYFCALEALNNLAKYAGATQATVSLSQTDGTLTFAVSDDGVGFSVGERGSNGTGLQGMADRLDAIGGALEIRSAPGEGTTVLGRVQVG
ncbi:MAG TPA: sensor histidine kinase, partial [Actinomycetota bacterium]|nr:sensor histidine kinase [Actinomycetota bacterium]